MSLLKPLLMSHSLFWIYCIRNIFPPKSNGMSSRHYLWWRWTWDKRCDLWHLKHSCQPPSYQPIVTTCAHISASPSFHSKEGPIPNPCTEVSVAATRTRSPILTEITGISGQSRAGFMVWAEYEEVVVGYTVVHLPPLVKEYTLRRPKILPVIPAAFVTQHANIRWCHPSFHYCTQQLLSRLTNGHRNGPMVYI